MARSNKSRLNRPKKKKKNNPEGKGKISIGSRLKNILKNKIIGKVKASQFRDHVKDSVGINLKKNNENDVFLVMSKDKLNQTFFFRDSDGSKVLVDRKGVAINEMHVDADIHKLKNVASQTIMQDGERFPRMILVADTKPMSKDEAKDIARQILESANVDGRDVQLKVAVRMFQGEDGKFHYRFRILSPSEVNLMNTQRAKLPPAIANQPTDIAVLDAAMNADRETAVSIDELVSRLPSQLTDADLNDSGENADAYQPIAAPPEIERETETESEASGPYFRPPAELAELDNGREKQSENEGGIYDIVPQIQDNVYGELELVAAAPELPDDPNYQSLTLLPHRADGNNIYSNVGFNPPAAAMVNDIYDVVSPEDILEAAEGNEVNQYDDFKDAIDAAESIGQNQYDNFADSIQV